VIFGDLVDELSTADGFIVTLLEVADSAPEGPWKPGQRVEIQAIYNQANEVDATKQ
jgi:hypothetical protein